ncbi:MAG: hypothetical protein ABSF29_11010 [Tepidisphaeraceae bacterium]|jgi:hypothetical protein
MSITLDTENSGGYTIERLDIRPRRTLPMRRPVCFLGLLLLLCRPIWGQTATPDDPVPDTLKAQTDLSAQADQLAQLVTTETQKLSDDSDAASQAMARDWLIAQATGINATDAYRTAYAAAVNKQFATILADPKVSVRTRVNVAIVTAKICETSTNTELLPTTLTLLGDSSDAIILWAERAAGSQLVTMLNNPNAAAADRQSLLKAMEEAAVKHCSTPMLGGFIIEQVYSDINPFLKGVNPQGAALDDLINANLALQKGRLELYTSAVPESPYVDTFASQFVLDPATWATMNPQEQLQAVQQAGDLICKAATLAIGGTNVSAQQLSDLTKSIGREGDYLDALASKSLNNSNLATAAKAVEILGVASPPASIRTACQQIEDALQAAFPGFQPSPDFAHPAAGSAGQ